MQKHNGYIEIDYESINLEKETQETYESMCRRIGEYINYVRENKGISLRELYRRTNISIAVLSDLENGQKLPRYETLIKLCIALEIPLEFIFGAKFVPLFRFNDKSGVKTPRSHDIIRNTFLNAGFNKDETKEIMNFVEFIKYKRSK